MFANINSYSTQYSMWLLYPFTIHSSDSSIDKTSILVHQCLKFVRTENVGLQKMITYFALHGMF